VAVQLGFVGGLQCDGVRPKGSVRCDQNRSGQGSPERVGEVTLMGPM